MGPDEKKSSLNNWASKRQKKWGNSWGPTYMTLKNNSFVVLLPHLRMGGHRIGSHRSMWAGWGRKGAAEEDCTSRGLQEQGMDSVSQESLSDLVMDNCLSTEESCFVWLALLGDTKRKEIWRRNGSLEWLFIFQYFNTGLSYAGDSFSDCSPCSIFRKNLAFY